MPPFEPGRRERGAAPAWRELSRRLASRRRGRSRGHDPGHDAAGEPELSPGPQQTYDLVAFVLRANGVVAGDEPLVADAPGLSAVLDSLGLDGEAASAPAADPAAVADRDRRITREAAAEEYVRPPGEREIEDFEPVTAEMLLDPDPGDWLMFRRTYDGQGHSPLDQVDAEQRRRAAPGLVLGDGGRREPADAAGLPRRDVPRQPAQHYPGAGG